MRSGEFKSNYHKQLAPMKALLSSIILCFVISGIGRLMGVAKELPTTEVKAQVVPEPSPTATPSPTPAPQTIKQEIIQEIVRVFGEDAPEAFNILHCENRNLNPDAINHNKNGSTDHSIFQINSIHTKRFGSKFKTDWKENIRVARVLQQEQGWKIWSCSSRIGVKSFWE